MYLDYIADSHAALVSRHVFCYFNDLDTLSVPIFEVNSMKTLKEKVK